MSGSDHPQRRSDVKELKEQADLFRSRLAECRSHGEALIAQRNGEHWAASVSLLTYFFIGHCRTLP